MSRFRFPLRRGTSPGASATRTRDPQRASSTPSTPESSARMTLSVASWRRMRPRLAPTAVRMAISRVRATALASNMFARLAHAISRTTATAASITHNVSRKSLTISSRTRVTATFFPLVAVGIFFRQPRADRGHLRLRLLHADARLQPRHHPVVVRGARWRFRARSCWPDTRCRCGRENGNLRASRRRRRESCPRGAECGRARLQLPPKCDCGVGVADDHRSGAAGLGFFGSELAAGDRLYAEDAKELRT